MKSHLKTISVSPLFTRQPKHKISNRLRINIVPPLESNNLNLVSLKLVYNYRPEKRLAAPVAENSGFSEVRDGPIRKIDSTQNEREAESSKFVESVGFSWEGMAKNLPYKEASVLALLWLSWPWVRRLTEKHVLAILKKTGCKLAEDDCKNSWMAILYSLRYLISYALISKGSMTLASKKAAEKIQEEAWIGLLAIIASKDILKEILVGALLISNGTLRMGDYIHIGSRRGIVIKLAASKAVIRDDEGFETSISYTTTQTERCRISHFLKRSMTIKLVMSRMGTTEIAKTTINIKNKIVEKFSEVLIKNPGDNWVSARISKWEGLTLFITLEYIPKRFEMEEELHLTELSMADEITRVVLADGQNNNNLYVMDKFSVSVRLNSESPKE